MRDANLTFFSPPKRAAGLTLVELLVALAIAALTASYVIPSLHTIVANNRQTSAINRFVMSVLLARSIAVTHRVEAVVCPSMDGLVCHDENDWSGGWIVVKESPTPGSSTAPEYEPVYVVDATLGVTVTSNRARFHFRPRNKRATNGTVVFCVSDATYPKAVIVSYNGRPRTSKFYADGATVECAG